MNKIIVIGREFGSGGRELGKRLAEMMGIAYYDKEIINNIAAKCGMAEEYVNSIIEKHIINYYPITIGCSFSMLYDFNPNPNPLIFSAQDDIIKELADYGDCVIIGRCADYILREYNPINIFVYADEAARINRCRERAPQNEHLSDAELKKQIAVINKNRRKYYEYYTGQKWGAKENYHLCINTSTRNIKELVPAVREFIK